MRPVDREVLRHEVALTDEVVLLDGDRPEVTLDGRLEATTSSSCSRVNGTARARCAWKDSQGATISVVRGSNLHDGLWHELTCRRQGSTFSLTVDSTTSSNLANFGSIANTAELTIGAKATDSDVFKGRIDEAQVSFSSS